jgi:hypothetical protein
MFYGLLAFPVLAIALLTLGFSKTVYLKIKEAKMVNEMNQVQTAVSSYYTEYSVYPAAPDNATLIKKLERNNPRHIRFFRMESRNANAKGELLDPWGTPFQFSVTAAGVLHVRSAGPDQTFGTLDDISLDTPLSP